MKILILPGDGIGPEIMAATMTALKALNDKHALKLDFEEHAVEMEGDEVLEGLGNVALDEIRHLNVALQRIDNGIYGICAECGAAIGKERLKAVPHATKCMDCLKE